MVCSCGHDRIADTLERSRVRSERTSRRASLREYASNDFNFSPDERGKWACELLIHEEDLQRKFHKWMVKTAKDEQLSVEAALEYLDDTLTST